MSFRIFSIILFFHCFLSSAQERPEPTARAIAAKLLMERQGQTLYSYNSKASEATLGLTLTPAAYVYTAASSFVLIGRSEAAPEVMGYGKMAYDATNSFAAMPPALKLMLEGSVAGSATYPPVGANWQPVAPLLGTMTRHQEAPYNACCPYYVFDDGTTSKERCVVGCVATALEEIMTYYQRPIVLQDTLHGWTTPHFSIPDILPGTSVDTRLIRNSYHDGTPYSAEEAKAVADLSYLCGVAAKMQYGTNESGAHVRDLIDPLRRAFGYGYVNYLDSYLYRPADFWNHLAAELEAARPVYFAGSAMGGGGHAFVLDGLDESGLFHVNWGYGGDFDGYFRLDVLSPWQERAEGFDETESNAGFFCNQEAITLHPDPQPSAFVPEALERTGHEVEVDSIVVGERPLTNHLTPLRMYVRNTTDTTLNTSFLFVDNAPTDTALLAQARFVAMTGCSLSPGEHACLKVDAVLKNAGKRLLSVTADGLSYLLTTVLQVDSASARQLEVAQPVLSYPTPTTVRATYLVRNLHPSQRLGTRIVCQLAQRTPSANGTRVSERTIGQVHRLVYLAPMCDTTLVMEHPHLSPATTYRLYCGDDWPLTTMTDFSTPSDTGLEHTALKEEEENASWHDLSGRRIAQPTTPGVYIRNGVKVAR